MKEVSRWQVRETQALLAYARAVGKLSEVGHQQRLRRLQGATTLSHLRHSVAGLHQPRFLEAAAAPLSEADRVYVRTLLAADKHGGREGGWWLAEAIAGAGDAVELRAVITGFLEGRAPRPDEHPGLALALRRRELWQRAWLARSLTELSKPEYRIICDRIANADDTTALEALAEQGWARIHSG